jgi:4,5-DOPA dioxygenase extradiol
MEKTVLPAFFIGHGSPMNIILDNPFTKMLKEMAKSIPKPKAILIISAHWLEADSLLSTTGDAETIYDFGGFPQALYEVSYPVKGSKMLADELGLATVDRGLDHGVWTLLTHMYPKADIPSMQMSIDYRLSLQEHFELGKKLARLRAKGVLIIGSGALTHNFQYFDRVNIDAFANKEAVAFDKYIQNIIKGKKYEELYKLSDIPVPLESVHPTLEHYVPLLYIAGMASVADDMQSIHEGFQYGAFSMRAWKVI